MGPQSRQGRTGGTVTVERPAGYRKSSASKPLRLMEPKAFSSCVPARLPGAQPTGKSNSAAQRRRGLGGGKLVEPADRKDSASHAFPEQDDLRGRSPESSFRGALMNRTFVATVVLILGIGFAFAQGGGGGSGSEGGNQPTSPPQTPTASPSGRTDQPSGASSGRAAPRPGAAQGANRDGFTECLAMWSPANSRMSQQEWTKVCDNARLKQR